ncbi:protein SRG1-like [Cryptomeria japonica]|uniref:protein SRG1-like n=1 Tax=Cryptomeria japonica TaxID=3369 RepID=UPI0027D9DFF5|nr:protein SRG1-like [Cryptomeria japonica]
MGLKEFHYFSSKEVFVSEVVYAGRDKVSAECDKVKSDFILDYLLENVEMERKRDDLLMRIIAVEVESNALAVGQRDGVFTCLVEGMKDKNEIEVVAEVDQEPNEDNPLLREEITSSEENEKEDDLAKEVAVTVRDDEEDVAEKEEYFLGILETLDQYAVEIQKLGTTVLSLLSEKVGLKPDCFINKFGKMSQTMRVNYYPPCPRPDLVLGLSPHSDASGLTVLLQDDETVGLQICKDGKWIPVQPIPGALLINIGDMLEVISNGIYNSIEYRAVTSTERDRISIAMFCSPSGETEMGPAPELIDELHPCQYRKFIRQEYMQHYFSSRLDGKGSLEFAKIKS